MQRHSFRPNMVRTVPVVRQAASTLRSVSKVGLVLGGGGITGAAYETAALMALELATGWDPNESEVIVGTSAGSYVAGLVRAGQLSLDVVASGGDDRSAVAEKISSFVFKPTRAAGLGRWLRYGLAPGLVRPGVRLVLGSPGRYSTDGIAEWAEHQIGPLSRSWPSRPTLITSYGIKKGKRVVFGTEEAPDVSLMDAIAASSAVPVIFSPHTIDGELYVDGGVVSGTHADLVLGNREPLDLVLIIAPMAADAERKGFNYDSLFDRVGKAALDREMATIHDAWPDTDVIVLRPEPEVLDEMRPNVMKAEAAVPTFIRTMTSMRTKLARSNVWSLLERHLEVTAQPGR